MRAPLLEQVEVGTRRAWRTWLERHHASSSGVWLVFHKEHTGVPSVPYDDSVREALCFGWVDSLIKRLDEDRYARKFTPRTGSRWSASNRKRWAELAAEGALAPAGRVASPVGAPSAVPPARSAIPEFPGYVERAFKANRKAWRFFQELTPRERRRFVGWIHIAKRPETRERRIRVSVALLTKGEKLGLK